MTLWAKVQQLSSDGMRQIHSAYGVHFPIEVRHFFSQWIESQNWAEIEEDKPEHEALATKLRDDLIQMLEDKAQELSYEDNFLNKLKLQETVQQFKEMYRTHPMNLVRVVKNCLATEQRLVQQTEASGMDNQAANAYRQIQQQLDFLYKMTQETEGELNKNQQMQESFIIQYQDSHKIQAQIQQLSTQSNTAAKTEQEEALQKQKQAVEKELSQKAKELLHARLQLADKHQETFTNLEALQHHVLEEQLITWKRQQQLAGNGAPFEGSLETLGQWCESLADLIWQNRQQISKMELLRAQLPINIPDGRQDLLPMLERTITGLLTSLVTSTFIIEKQPPQVLKKDSRFTATVRLLVGGKLNVHMNPPAVKATIISEDQARSLMASDNNVRNQTSGDILNNTGTMEYHQANGVLSVTFRNMALKRIRRAEKKGNETVTEEKFSILFQSQFSVGGRELVFHVWTLSLPVVVTVHGNQECNALATILWDNAFAETGRRPFQVPDKVTWPQLADALNTRFAASCGLGLSQDNIVYLAFKLFGQADDYTNQMVTWAHFNREPLAGRNFTFWEWFYAILKLTKEWLAAPWKESYVCRLIIGFISKFQAQEWLLTKPNGTFLLRFSDSEIGGITIAWVNSDPKNPMERQVWNLAPFTDKDFRIRSIGDRIKDLDNLLYLYPDIPKSRAFSKFWTQSAEPPTINKFDYVPSNLVTQITGLSSQGTVRYDDRAPEIMMPGSPNGAEVLPTQAPTQAAAAEVKMEDDPLEAEREDLWGDMATDYQLEDIEQINVNELLSQYCNNY